MTDQPPPAAPSPGAETADIRISAAAAARIHALMEAENDSALMLRVTVSGGGCSGFSYGFDLERTAAEDDLLFEQHGVKVVIDEASLDLLHGSEIDYTDDLMAAAFTVRNPNATSTCGCGTSFSV
ncbi:iron-sulfur cluster assembly accessory protein [Rhodospirillum rubrum]|uniref:iron-sulfur cluster insertion protein ErpA n=2 Tax=Rhodospirillum rubrum TaxID=1085 RepID=UPI0019084FDA|nr:iron-sulfur cluster insertion protein ErpA [Rhodospirillum rubrum]MBK1663581.1 iron-sulfur cluster assembly accessory protein [Rhodospirillum rubrum]